MNLSPLPIQKFWGNDGRPLAGGLLFTYVAGTDTKIATYVDASGGAQNTNPIVLDFRGECRLWIDPELAYKFVLSPRGDTDPPTHPIWSVDDITINTPLLDFNYSEDTGPVNSIQLSLPRLPSPEAGMMLTFKARVTNTGATTLTLNGGTSQAVTGEDLDALHGDEIQANGIYTVIFDGARWQMQGFSGVYVGSGKNTGNDHGTAVGKGALQSTGPGEDNTAVGYSALRISQGLRNTGVGSRTMFNSSSAYQNTALGNESLYSQTFGSRNVAVGESALWSLIDFAENTAVGSAALFSCNAHKNTAIGREAGYYVSSGEMNVYFGYDSGINQTTGNQNTGLGTFSLQGQQTLGVGSSTGTGNTSVGFGSCAQLTSGNYNATLGHNTLTVVTSGSENVAVGRNSLQLLTTGSSNVGIGSGSLGAVTTGGTNLGLGTSAGSAITTGSNNVVIGGNSGSAIATLSNRIIISDGAGNSRIEVNATGQTTFNAAVIIPAASYFIGNASNGYRFNNGADTLTRVTIADGGVVTFHAYGAGTLTTNASGVISATSDLRAKDVCGTFTRGLDDLQKVWPILYRWKAGSHLEDGATHAGFGAQDLLKAIPEAIGGNEDDGYTLSDRPLIATLWNAVRELSERLSAIEDIHSGSKS